MAGEDPVLVQLHLQAVWTQCGLDVTATVVVLSQSDS